ncbi:hypothetical protein GCM10028794_19250 [Silanimonas algicola]
MTVVFWPCVAASLLATRWAEGAPTSLAWLLVVLAIGAGLRRVVRVRREPVGVLELLPGRRARWFPAGGAVTEGPAAVHEQWPVTTIRFAGCGTTVVFWPDTLCAPGRRLLRRWDRMATPVSPLPQFWMG